MYNTLLSVITRKKTRVPESVMMSFSIKMTSIKDVFNMFYQRRV